MARLQRLRLNEEQTYRRALQRYERAAVTLPLAFRAATRLPEFVCKVRDTRAVTCAPLYSLLAAVESDTTVAMLLDLDSLYGSFALDPAKEILVQCGRFSWTTTEPSELGYSDFSDVIEALKEGETLTFTKKCDQVAARVRIPGAPGGAAGLGRYSGITGFDSLAIGGMCGLSLSGSNASTARDMIAKFEEQNAAFNQQCKTTLAGSMMEGSDSTDDEDDDQETVTPNGDGTETVCTQHGCYVRYQRGSSSSGGGSSGGGSSGGSNSGGATNPAWTCDASNNCSMSVSGLDKNNKPYTVTVRREGDGTQTVIIDHSDGWQSYHVVTPDDYEYAMICRESLCIDGAAGPGEDIDPGALIEDWDWGIWDRYKQLLEQGLPGNVGDCLDETSCTSCRDQYNAMSDLKLKCMASGRSSMACQSYLNESDCCGDPNVFPADPRIVLPNPDGALVCAATVAPSVQETACKARCGVADHVDCIERCEASPHGVFEHDMMDVICTKAMWDRCVSSEPQEVNVAPEPPAPPVLTDRLLFPETSSRVQL
jgi:hypothetical protein